MEGQHIPLEAGMTSKGYAHPQALVDTQWVADHLNDPAVRFIESNEDYLLYETGHIPGAAKADWFTTLQHPVRRDFLDRTAFERLCSDLGISRDTLIVFYGDKSNWFAAYALWIFRYYGHERLAIMDGGRTKWFMEGRPVTKEVPRFAAVTYHARERDESIRAYREQVFEQIERQQPLIDVRSRQEYTGELLHMPNYPQEGALRGGHIPGAINIPWSKAVDEPDGTFKPADELRQLYSQFKDPQESIVAYCRIGERSAHTWFALTYLLGYGDVRNYDGSWTEWGNLVGSPIEK
jgi:thiosulfate/3-mercaptopyruvate sulfurtransferase